jgi:hypothetical protein
MRLNARAAVTAGKTLPVKGLDPDKNEPGRGEDGEKHEPRRGLACRLPTELAFDEIEIGQDAAKSERAASA